jgi:hypothetical protein
LASLKQDLPITGQASVHGSQKNRINFMKTD